MKQTSRLLALVLAICMVISVVPAFALAEDAPAEAPAVAVAAPAEAPAPDVAEEAAAPAVAPAQTQALSLAAATLQGNDDIVKTFQSDADALAAGYKVKVVGNATGYFKTFDHYAWVAAQGHGAKKPSTITLLDDVTINDVNTVITGTNAVGVVGSIFGVDAAASNSTSNYVVVGNSSTQCNGTSTNVLDLGGHTLSYSGGRNVFGGMQYGLIVQNGNIVINNTGGRGFIANGSTTGATSNSGKTSAYKPSFAFKNVEAYCTGGCFFASYNWNPTVQITNCKILTDTDGALQINKANTDTFYNGEAPKATVTIKNSTIGSVKTNGQSCGLVYYNGYKTAGETSVYNFYSNNKMVGSVEISVDKDTRIVYGADDVICRTYANGFIEPTGMKIAKEDNVTITINGENYTAPHVRSYEVATEVASYTPYDSEEPQTFENLTEALLAALNDPNATVTEPAGVVTLLVDVELKDEAGFIYNKSGSYAAGTGNGVFTAPQVALDIDFGGCTVTNATTKNAFYLDSKTPDDLVLKISNGSYTSSTASGRSFVAISGTEDDTTDDKQEVILDGMTIYTGVGSSLNSFASQATFSLNNCKVYCGGSNAAVTMGMGATVEQIFKGAEIAEYKPHLILQGETKLGSYGQYGVNFPIYFSNGNNEDGKKADKTKPEIVGPYGNDIPIADRTSRAPQITVKGEAVEIYGNNKSSNWAIISWNVNKDVPDILDLESGVKLIEESVTAGFGLSAVPAEIPAAARGRFIFVNPDNDRYEAAYTSVNSGTNYFESFADAVKAAATDTSVTTTTCGTVKLLKDVAMDGSYIKTVGDNDNGIIANDSKNNGGHKAYHFDLGGHTLTNGTDAWFINFSANGYETVTIENGCYIANGSRSLATWGASSSENSGADNNGITLNLENLDAIAHGSNQLLATNFGGTEINIVNCHLAHKAGAGSEAGYCIALQLGGTDGAQRFEPVVNITDSTIAADHSAIGVATKTQAKSGAQPIANPQPRINIFGDTTFYTADNKSTPRDITTNYNIYGTEPYFNYKFRELDAKGTPEVFGDELGELNKFAFHDTRPEGDGGDFKVTFQNGDVRDYSTFGTAIKFAMLDGEPATVTLGADVEMCKADSLSDTGATGSGTHYITLMPGADLTIDLAGHTIVTADGLEDSTGLNMTAFCINSDNTHLTLKSTGERGTIATKGTRGIVTCGTTGWKIEDSSVTVDIENINMKTGTDDAFILSNFADGVTYTVKDCIFDPQRGEAINADNPWKNKTLGFASDVTINLENCDYTGTGEKAFAIVDSHGYNAATITFDPDTAANFAEKNIINHAAMPDLATQQSEDYTSYVFGNIFAREYSVSLEENIRVNFYLRDDLGVDSEDLYCGDYALSESYQGRRVTSSNTKAKTLREKDYAEVSYVVEEGDATKIYHADGAAAAPTTVIDSYTKITKLKENGEVDYTKDANGNDKYDYLYLLDEDDFDEFAGGEQYAFADGRDYVGLATLAAATINYGAKAQEYFAKEKDYEIKSGANISGILEDRPDLREAIDGINIDGFADKEREGGDGTSYVGSTAILVDTLEISFYFRNGTGAPVNIESVQLGSTTLGETKYTVDHNHLAQGGSSATFTVVTVPVSATEIDANVIVTFDGNTVTDSIAAYCNRQMAANNDGGVLYDVCEAIMKYGTAANVCFGS